MLLLTSNEMGVKRENSREKKDHRIFIRVASCLYETSITLAIDRSTGCSLISLLDYVVPLVAPNAASAPPSTPFYPNDLSTSSLSLSLSLFPPLCSPFRPSISSFPPLTLRLPPPLSFLLPSLFSH